MAATQLAGGALRQWVVVDLVLSGVRRSAEEGRIQSPCRLSHVRSAQANGDAVSRVDLNAIENLWRADNVDGQTAWEVIEYARELEEALLWVAITPTGIPGHAVAVGCHHPKEAADLLGVTGLGMHEARQRVGLGRNDEKAEAALAACHAQHMEEFRQRHGWGTADNE